jgi:hypothetical protein
MGTMMPFKILTNRLPKKWQADLRETLGDAAAPLAADTKTGDSATDIMVTAESSHIVETLVKWIQRMNRQQKSTKPARQTFPTQGINLTIEKPDGTRITLTERNVGVVKQFLERG